MVILRFRVWSIVDEILRILYFTYYHYITKCHSFFYHKRSVHKNSIMRVIHFLLHIKMQTIFKVHAKFSVKIQGQFLDRSTTEFYGRKAKFLVFIKIDITFVKLLIMLQFCIMLKVSIIRIPLPSFSWLKSKLF